MCGRNLQIHLYIHLYLCIFTRLHLYSLLLRSCVLEKDSFITHCNMMLQKEVEITLINEWIYEEQKTCSLLWWHHSYNWVQFSGKDKTNATAENKLKSRNCIMMKKLASPKAENVNCISTLLKSNFTYCWSYGRELRNTRNINCKNAALWTVPCQWALIFILKRFKLYWNESSQAVFESISERIS